MNQMIEVFVSASGVLLFNSKAYESKLVGRGTVRKVMIHIFNKQKSYLRFRVESMLVPLGLKEIASALGVAESTVSRAIKGSRVHLSSRYKDEKDEILDVSFFLRTQDELHGLKVKEKILVLDEARRLEGKVPLNDAQMSVHLRAMEGLRVARRTVAKYRSQIGMGTQKERRVAREA